MTANKTEMELQSEAWLKRLRITQPCGLDKLNGAELRDLARQIDWAVNQAYTRGLTRNRLGCET